MWAIKAANMSRLSSGSGKSMRVYKLNVRGFVGRLIVLGDLCDQRKVALS